MEDLCYFDYLFPAYFFYIVCIMIVIFFEVIFNKLEGIWGMLDVVFTTAQVTSVTAYYSPNMDGPGDTASPRGQNCLN